LLENHTSNDNQNDSNNEDNNKLPVLCAEIIYWNFETWLIL